MVFGKVSIALVAITLILAINHVESKRIKGSIKTSSDSKDNWVPFAQFFFGGGENRTRYVTYTLDHIQTNNLTLVLYDDESDDWGYVWANRKTLNCTSKIDPNGNPNITDRILAQPLTGDTNGSILIGEHYPRLWVFVFADCGGNQLEVNYDFHFVNTGGSNDREFSLEDQGNYGLNVAFFILYLFLIGAHTYGAFSLYRAGSLHNIVKLLSFSIMTEFFGIMFQMIHTSQYARNGVGSYGSWVFGNLLSFFSQMCFLFLLVLLSRGYAISHNDFGNKRFLLIALAVYLVFFFIWWAWRLAAMNVTLYPMYSWGTAPGILFILTRIAFLGYFLFNLRNSHRVEGHPTKRRFYVIFGGVAIGYLLYFPFVAAFVALIYIHQPYMLEKSVTGNLLVLNWGMFIFMTYLFWPSQISKYFEVNKSDMLISSSSPTSPYETL